MNSQQMEFSYMNERTRYLSYVQGSCARSVPEDDFYHKLTPSHLTSVKIPLNRFLFAGFRKLQFLCARALCVDKAFLRELLLLHRECPDACRCLHMVQQQNCQNYNKLLTYSMI